MNHVKKSVAWAWTQKSSCAHNWFLEISFLKSQEGGTFKELQRIISFKYVLLDENAWSLINLCVSMNLVVGMH